MRTPGAGPSPEGGAPRARRPPPAPGVATGRAVVVSLMLVAAGLASFAVWFQWWQTRRCLSFFGPEVVRRIQSASRVELWRLGDGGSRPRVVDRLDVSRAAGLVHLRRGLVEDANYKWSLSGPRPAAATWDEALAFFDTAAAPVPSAVVAFDLDAPETAATVAGSPGRVGLGRLGPGIRAWIAATRPGPDPDDAARTPERGSGAR